jgi:hypothetical protein
MLVHEQEDESLAAGMDGDPGVGVRRQTDRALVDPELEGSQVAALLTICEMTRSRVSSPVGITWLTTSLGSP